MLRFAVSIGLCVLGLVGCASAPVTQAVAQPPWRDLAFDYDASLVTVGRAELFRLDPELLARLDTPQARQMSTQARYKHLMALVFGPDRQRFGYAAGHSTTAAETWRNQRGDCLSLTVLAYSAARALGMAVQMQEVQTPALFDRRGRLDVVNQHVNVVFRRAYRDLRDAEPRDMVVDFEPYFSTRRPGRSLTEDAVVARYYNNIATEHLGSGRRALAYAHFKAAIQADPGYAASYGNLAVLYRDAGLVTEAEQLLRRAVALGDTPDVPLHALHQMLTEQGRTAEARQLARALQAGRERDPYHWIGMGLQHLADGDARRAIDALEQAKDLANGFDEIHRYLAVAYAHAGETRKAREELALVASLAGDERVVSKLKRKIRSVQQ